VEKGMLPKNLIEELKQRKNFPGVCAVNQILRSLGRSPKKRHQPLVELVLAVAGKFA
jgi:hypothetical protein